MPTNEADNSSHPQIPFIPNSRLLVTSIVPQSIRDFLLHENGRGGMIRFARVRHLVAVMLIAALPASAARVAVPPQFHAPSPAEEDAMQNLLTQSDDAHKAGDFIRESQTLRAAMRIVESTYGPMHPETAERYFKLSYLFYAHGEDGLAEAMIRPALRIHEGLGMSKDAGLDMLHFGTVLIRRDRYGEAADVLHAAVKTIHAQHDDAAEATALYRLAITLSRLGRYDEAAAKFDDAL